MRLRSVMTMALACAASAAALAATGPAAAAAGPAAALSGTSGGTPGGSVGNCSAGGFYTDKHDDIQAFVVDEKNGHWHAAQEVAAKLNVKGYAEITDVTGEDSQGQKIRTRHLERTGATLVPPTLRPAALIAGPGRFGPGLLAGSGYGS
jgi:hypothetical protein